MPRALGRVDPWQEGFVKTSHLEKMMVGALLVAIALPVWAAGGNGNLMQITTHVRQTMSGMPPIPPRTLTSTVCTRAGQLDRQGLAELNSKGQCKITQYQKQGNVIRFEEVCTAPMAVTSRGEFHLTGGPDFTGSMHTTFSAAGHAIAVDTAYTGKKLGSCNYQPPKSAD
ncbi:MAG: DUF3617 family protein [Rhodanobacteraceae bacterium]|nr:MAG: DUF3617 family protein [Rhodanobacteraceae bacterium]